ncbi:MAG: VOC family protein [Pseudomonadales bacterium]|nr:VOC family protein [Pseudomonadales bacterium]MBO6596729.1 VOC family protein [Pseudomonadales bacterium]MBO6656031.1 VOC family protein [Pseudomonadales bacterium]MBO6823282.1 VOC family protein [Pseudomonadales bacterium]
MQSKGEVYPLIWTKDVAGLGDWATSSLGIEESWRSPGEDGTVEHLELHWMGGKVSINIDTGKNMEPSGISIRVDTREMVDQIHERAVVAGANISQGLQESVVAYSFTATDPDGNEWWVNAETGMLDQLRESE